MNTSSNKVRNVAAKQTVKQTLKQMGKSAGKSAAKQAARTAASTAVTKSKVVKRKVSASKTAKRTSKTKTSSPKVSVTPALLLEVQLGVATKDIPSKRLLQRWADAAYRVHHASFAGRRRITPVQVSLRIVGAAESRQLNHTWRDKDYATNVLSFPAGELPEFGDEPPSLGDLAICVPVVKREAKQQGKTLQSHWAHMMIHGVLHLLGYDHEVERDAQVMEACEVALMQSFGFANPYQS